MTVTSGKNLTDAIPFIRMMSLFFVGTDYCSIPVKNRMMSGGCEPWEGWSTSGKDYERLASAKKCMAISSCGTFKILLWALARYLKLLLS